MILAQYVSHTGHHLAIYIDSVPTNLQYYCCVLQTVDATSTCETSTCRRRCTSPLSKSLYSARSGRLTHSRQPHCCHADSLATCSIRGAYLYTTVHSTYTASTGGSIMMGSGRPVPPLFKIWPQRPPVASPIKRRAHSFAATDGEVGLCFKSGHPTGPLVCKSWSRHCTDLASREI